MKTRWETGATEITTDKLLEVVKDKERKYRLESDEYEKLISEIKGGNITNKH
jgi:hypothetical protein